MRPHFLKRKSGAKLLLFFELTKFFCIFFTTKCIFMSNRPFLEPFPKLGVSKKHKKKQPQISDCLFNDQRLLLFAVLSLVELFAASSF